MNHVVDYAAMNPGYYLGIDVAYPGVLVPLISEGGRLHAVNVHDLTKDRALARDGFKATIALCGPMDRVTWLQAQIKWE